MYRLWKFCVPKCINFQKSFSLGTLSFWVRNAKGSEKWRLKQELKGSRFKFETNALISWYFWEMIPLGWKTAATYKAELCQLLSSFNVAYSYICERVAKTQSKPVSSDLHRDASASSRKPKALIKLSVPVFRMEKEIISTWNYSKKFKGCKRGMCISKDVKRGREKKLFRGNNDKFRSHEFGLSSAP